MPRTEPGVVTINSTLHVPQAKAESPDEQALRLVNHYRRIEAGDLLMVTQLDRSASIIHGRSLELLNCHLFVWKRNLRNKHTGSV